MTEAKAEVNIDQKQYNDLSIITEHVTLFPQEPEIFESTIEYNISLGLNFEKPEIDEICKIVAFESVVKELPDGLETDIKEKGNGANWIMIAIVMNVGVQSANIDIATPI